VMPAPPTTSLSVQHTDGAPSGTCPIVVVRTYTVTDLCGNVTASLTRISTSMTLRLRHSTDHLSAINIKGYAIGACQQLLTLPAWWLQELHQRCLHPQQPAQRSA